VVPDPATEALARVTVLPPVAADPRPVEAPIGKLFEPTDVDQSPKVATRVAPQLPADLPVDSLNDVVVVRVLVSQTGHPSRVSVLRGSRLGRSLDDAVVAAVKQWAFSPAMKRGEAVSSWYNIGVPLGGAS
jgi:TonB family protein